MVAPQPFFSERGTPFSVYYRALVLTEEGAEVDLVTYGQGQDVEVPGLRLVRIPSFGIKARIPVGPSLVKALLDVFLAMYTVGLLLRRRYDFVHAHEEGVFICRVLKPIFGFRLVYDMHSSLPKQLSVFGFTSSRFLIGAFDRLERSCLRACDAVITISPALAEYATALMPNPDQHVLIENSIFEPVKLAEADGTAGRRGPSTHEDSERFELPDRPIVAYAGTFEAYQGIELLLEAFALARVSRPNLFLLLIGGQPAQVAHHQSQATRLGLDGHCLFTGSLPQQIARSYLARAEVLTSPRTRGSNTPLKVYELLAGDQPFVATRILSHTQVLDDTVCYLCEPEKESMAEALLEALDENAARTKQRLAGARALFRERYSRKAYTQKIRRLLGILGLCAASPE